MAAAIRDPAGVRGGRLVRYRARRVLGAPAPPDETPALVAAPLALAAFGAVVALAIVAPFNRLVVDDGPRRRSAGRSSRTPRSRWERWPLRRSRRDPPPGGELSLPSLVAAGVAVVYLLSVAVVDHFQLQVAARPLEELQKEAQVGLSALWSVLGAAGFATGLVCAPAAGPPVRPGAARGRDGEGLPGRPRGARRRVPCPVAGGARRPAPGQRGRLRADAASAHTRRAPARVSDREVAAHLESRSGRSNDEAAAGRSRPRRGPAAARGLPDRARVAAPLPVARDPRPLPIVRLAPSVIVTDDLATGSARPSLSEVGGDIGGEDASASPPLPSPRRHPGGPAARDRLPRGYASRAGASAPPRCTTRRSSPASSSGERVPAGSMLGGGRDRAYLDGPLHHGGHSGLRRGWHHGPRRVRPGRPRCLVSVSGAQVRVVGHQLPGGCRRPHSVGAPERRGPRHGWLPDHPAGHETARLRRHRDRGPGRDRRPQHLPERHGGRRRARTSSPEDGDFFPCMIAAEHPGRGPEIPVVRSSCGGCPAGVSLSRSFGGTPRVHAARRRPGRAGPGALHHVRTAGSPRRRPSRRRPTTTERTASRSSQEGGPCPIDSTMRHRRLLGIARACERIAGDASGSAAWHCPSPPPRTSRSTRTPGSPAGTESDFRCGIHTRLRQEGFQGCTVYDLVGAGQQVSQVTFGGRDWRRAPETARRMFEVFAVVRHLHELLWYLAEALTLERPHGARRTPPRARRDRAARAAQPGRLVALDVNAYRGRLRLLSRTSELVRADVRAREDRPRGADLVGEQLRDADLRGANLRGAYLIAADLTGADLRSRPDRRRSPGRRTHRRRPLHSIFLTQFQLNAATGDVATRLPPALAHPLHWQAERGLAE